MKHIYNTAYHIICSRGNQRNCSYLNETYHYHHIIPKHSGGTDEKTNITYITLREHIIAHYLLWKLHKNVNDLRALKMLGANLNRKYRQKIGRWCYDNKIGCYGASKEQKSAWRLKGNKTQMERKVGIFNPDKRKEYASIGGKASIKSPNNPWSYWASKEGRSHRGSLGGKAHLGKICMYKPGESSFIRVTKESIESYKEKGYIIGSPHKPNLSRKLGPSKNRKKVTDGNIVYDSVHDAAQKNSISPSAIVYRCNSEKSTWRYVYESEL